MLRRAPASVDVPSRDISPLIVITRASGLDSTAETALINAALIVNMVLPVAMIRGIAQAAASLVTSLRTAGNRAMTDTSAPVVRMNAETVLTLNCVIKSPGSACTGVMMKRWLAWHARVRRGDGGVGVTSVSTAVGGVPWKTPAMIYWAHV